MKRSWMSRTGKYEIFLMCPCANRFRSARLNKGVQLVMPVEYRGNVIEDFMRKLRKVFTGSSFDFVTLKLRSQICQLKAPFTYVYKRKVVDERTCPGCSGTYLGQTVRYLSQDSKNMGWKTLQSINIFGHAMR